MNYALSDIDFFGIIRLIMSLKGQVKFGYVVFFLNYSYLKTKQSITIKIYLPKQPFYWYKNVFLKERNIKFNISAQKRWQ